MHVLYRSWSAERKYKSQQCRAYLVPVLLHAPFCSLREGLTWQTTSQIIPFLQHDSPFRKHAVSWGWVGHLCDFAPGVSRISHCLEPLFLSWRPRRICPTLLLGFLRGRVDIGALIHGSSRGSDCARHLVLRQGYRLPLPRVSWRGRPRKGCKGLLGLRCCDGRLETGKLSRCGEGRALLRVCGDGRRLQIAFGRG